MGAPGLRFLPNYVPSAVLYLCLGHGNPCPTPQSLTATTSEGIGMVSRSPAERNVHLPIYEDLVRERGDVVAEAQMAAAHTQDQAADLLGGEEPHSWDGPAGQQSHADFG